MQNIRALRLQTPQTAPPIANFWLRACQRHRKSIMLLGLNNQN